MKIIVTDKLIMEYLQGKNLNDYAQEWFFSVARPFTRPAADPQTKEKVKKQYSCMHFCSYRRFETYASAFKNRKTEIRQRKRSNRLTAAYGN